MTSDWLRDLQFDELVTYPSTPWVDAFCDRPIIAGPTSRLDEFQFRLGADVLFADDLELLNGGIRIFSPYFPNPAIPYIRYRQGNMLYEAPGGMAMANWQVNAPFANPVNPYLVACFQNPTLPVRLDATFTANLQNVGLIPNTQWVVRDDRGDVTPAGKFSLSNVLILASPGGNWQNPTHVTYTPGSPQLLLYDGTPVGPYSVNVPYP